MLADHGTQSGYTYSQIRDWSALLSGITSRDPTSELVLYRLILRWTHARRFGRPGFGVLWTADDLAHEIYLRVWDGLTAGRIRLRDPAAFPGYLLHTGRNVLLEKVRVTAFRIPEDRRSQPELYDRTDSSVMPSPVLAESKRLADYNTPESILSQSEEGTRRRSAVILRFRSLPPQRRRVAMLVMEGREDRDIADKLGRSPITVKVQRLRIVAQLRSVSVGSVSVGPAFATAVMR